MTATELTSAPITEVEHGRDEGHTLTLGDWVWVSNRQGRKTPKVWFGCITHVGSNYVEVTEPRRDNSKEVIRVHLDEVLDVLRYEPNHRAVIAEKIAFFQGRVSKSLAAAREISQRLGVSTVFTGQADTGSSAGTGLAVMSQTSDVVKYEQDLIKAKNVELPEIFEQIKQDNHSLCQWMSAESLGLMAEFDQSKSAIAGIEDRIFNISLYAGLIESVSQCCDGQPASINDRLHIMQRRLYMDEESLLDYQHGGMEFSDIQSFDAWISRPKNRDRILPFPRCIVAMRIRRHGKERQNLNTIVDFLLDIEKGLSDKFTYLYIRNGEQVYRLSTEIDFDEKIFPDRADFDPSEPMMFRPRASRSDRAFMPVREYDALLARQEELERLAEQWEKDNPDENHWFNPHARESDGFHPDSWTRLDSSSVYFDDGMQRISDVVKKYNRVSLIVQGLLDRSSCLHPHPPIRMWNPEEFSQYIRLVYDAENVLHHGEPPDFEAYRRRCNESLGKGSVVVGQRKVWLMREAERENNRNRNNWRLSNRMPDYKEYEPYGNPGPDYVAVIQEWQPRARRAIFRWQRESQANRNFGVLIDDTITVCADDLFNVSAYQPGDYLQFFQDPRTREQYLAWAPLLMAAEDFKAGVRVSGRRDRFSGNTFL